MEYFFKLEELLRHLKKAPQDWVYVYAGAALALVLLGLVVFYFRKFFTLIAKSLLRNLVRTGLTSLVIMILVFVVTLVWSFLVVLDLIMTEKSKDFKAIVTERWQLPSQMPYAYAAALERGAAKEEGDTRPEDTMTWSFYGGTTDGKKPSFENIVFFFVLDPHKIKTMMDDAEKFDDAAISAMASTREGVLLGKDRLARMNKRVGETITVTSMNYKGIDLECKIVGVCPDGRYNGMGFMNRDYLLAALDDYKRKNNKEHPLAGKALNLFWMKVSDTPTFEKLSGQILNSAEFSAPAVKVETASSGISAWLDPYKDLLWGLKWFLVPCILIVMALVIAIAISISVRERRTEMAVLKVLGFGPWRIMALVLGEAMLIGAGSGLLSAGLTYLVIHVLSGGIKFQIAFFPVFDVYVDCLWWGVLFGSLTAFVGSIVPAWSARSIKVSEVFSKIA